MKRRELLRALATSVAAGLIKMPSKAEGSPEVPEHRHVGEAQRVVSTPVKGWAIPLSLDGRLDCVDEKFRELGRAARNIRGEG